jgi:hypothetical protein
MLPVFTAAVDDYAVDLESPVAEGEEVGELTPVAGGAVIGAALDRGHGDFLGQRLKT